MNDAHGPPTEGEVLEIGLGSQLRFVEEGRDVWQRPKPRGLLPVPPEVAMEVAEEESRIRREHGFGIAAEARKRSTDFRTLFYFYEDHFVAYRIVPEGVEVLAVGEDEVGAFLRSTTSQQRTGVVYGVP